ncbi:MAG: D-Ala-D-Ala carboxypeptidase family metallohydrolase [Pseudomonadota bacterium]
MNLSPHLSLAEFTMTGHRSLDNTLPTALMPEAERTAQLLERVRSALGDKPILVTSGYRSPAVNAAVGSGPGSDHPKAAALDFHCPGFGSAYEVAKHLEPLVDQLGIGQLIYEQTWVHISTRMQAKAVNRVLTMRNGNYTPGVNL